jgi:hypothetical protein
VLTRAASLAGWTASGRLGYAGFRRGDAAVMRVLLREPLPVGRLGVGLGVTRQAARKIADALEQRGAGSHAPSAAAGEISSCRERP